MLTMRRRGKAQNWYIRGNVALGDRRVDVAEFRTNTADKEAASHLMSAREQELREELMFGPKARTVRAVIADAFETYLTKPKPPSSTDVVRVGVMNEQIGGMPLSEPKAAWHAFREAYLTFYAPAGQDRYRSLLQAAVNVYNERHDLPSFKLKAIPFGAHRSRVSSSRMLQRNADRPGQEWFCSVETKRKVCSSQPTGCSCFIAEMHRFQPTIAGLTKNFAVPQTIFARLRSGAITARAAEFLAAYCRCS